MFEIIPSPGTQDKTFEEIEKKLLAVKGIARTIHIDIIDGYFAANKTFSNPAPFAKYSKEFNLEIHLMVHDPIKHLKPWADIGAGRFIGQIEKMPDQVEFVATAQRLGEVALGIDLDTPLNHLKVPLIDLDAITIMAIAAGFSGQSFNEHAMEKVKKIAGQSEIPIEVDGGISDETIRIAKDAGATRFVTSSFLFDKGESSKNQHGILVKELNLKMV